MLQNKEKQSIGPRSFDFFVGDMAVWVGVSGGVIEMFKMITQ